MGSFEVKKTNELSAMEFEQVASLFVRVFHRDITAEGLRSGYMNNPLGYSVHSIMKDEGTIVAFNTWSPFYFKYHGKRVLFANSITSMVDVPYRGITIFYSLVKKGYSYLSAEGFDLVYAYPNDISHPVFSRMKLLLDVGKMHTYCLPYRIGGIKQSLKWLNPISIAFCRIWVFFAGLFAGSKKEEYVFTKDEDFLFEYRLNNPNYRIIKNKGGSFVYCIKKHEGIRTAFLIEVLPKSPLYFNQAVKYILKHESKNVDLVLYPGSLSFTISSMIRIPLKHSPKNFNFSALILNKEIGDEVWDIKNWDTNLANYDLI